ncbi:MAG: SusC/RagA family TonB-linked outer membrane protein [Gemmatimonadaceae bacterium]
MATVRYFILACAGTLLAAAQLGAQGSMGAITGRVVDSASNQPIAAVTVRIEGTARGTVTRDDGTYMLGTVPVGTARVRAARIGYAPLVADVTVTAGAPVTANFTLAPAGVILEPVVTTGYGTQRREAITGSVATVSGDDANVGVITNANEMIQGRVAGVDLTTNNGEPGAGSQIRIRGGTSISASNEPLYVIDGVPINNAPTESRGIMGGDVGGFSPSLQRSPLNLLNPSDIESITILKDASATAIYGSRAANGVILIQTKKGNAGGGATMEYDGYVAMASPSNYLDLLTGSEYRAFLQSQLSATPAADTMNRRLWTERIARQGNADTDWEREVTRSAVTHNHNLSFSGGREDTRYRASLNYMDQEGIVIANGLQRIQGRLNASHNAFEDRFRLGLNLTASHLINDYLPFENTGGFEGAVFTNVAIFNPTRPVTTTDPATGRQRFFEIGSGPQSVRNPVALAEQIIDEGKTTRALGNVVAELDLFSGVTAQVNAGADRSESVRQTYFPNENPIGAQFRGLAQQVDRNLTSKTLQTLLTYRGQLLETHAVDVVGGYEFNEYTTEEFGAQGRGFITDLFSFNNLGGAQTLVPPMSWREDSRLVSFFGRANYSFNETYYLTGVLRRDGASQFGAGNKWATFPAVSASWRLSQGDFLPSYVSELRLRAGWGKQGNAAVRPYQSLLLLAPGPRAAFGSTAITAITQSQNANPNLKWEETEQINFAVDYGFLNNRFAGTIEYYIKNTDDLLLEVDVPQPANVARRLENIGSLRNTGLEISLDALAMARQNFTWQAGLVFAAEQNKVVDLGARSGGIITGSVSGQGQSNTFSQRIIEGEPLGTFFGPVYVGVDSAGKQLFKCSTPSASCVNGRTTLASANDYEVLGDANPDFTFGLTSRMNWRGFDASFLVRGEFGQEVFNNGALVYSTKGNALQDKNFLRAALSDPIGIAEPAIYSSRWIEDGSFVRLQNVTVGYTLDIPAFFGGSPRPIRVYVSGDNLLMLTDYTGYDPEVHTDAGLASRGIEYVTYPRARTITAGFRVQF